MKIINLKNKNICFTKETKEYKILTFRKDKMSVELEVRENGILQKNEQLVFAHLPKKIKALLNPK